jgi:hypothetical protein
VESQEWVSQARLDALEEGLQRVGSRVVAPWWYYAALGVVVGGYLLTVPVPYPWKFLCYALLPIALFLHTRLGDRIRGFRPHGDRPGRGRMLAYFAVGGALGIGCAELAQRLGVVWVLVPVAVLAGVTTAWQVRRDDRRQAARLRAGQA